MVVPDAAYNVYRNTGIFYKALISRPDVFVKRYTIAAGAIEQVMTAGNPHSVTLRNYGSEDLRFGHDAHEAESTTEYSTLQAGEERKFDYHISGYEWDTINGKWVQKAIFHCEWSDAMYIYNPSAIAVIVEVFIVG